MKENVEDGRYVSVHLFLWQRREEEKDIDER